MANVIQLKRSSIAGRLPETANVQVGEPVVNLADRKVYTKNGSGSIIQIASGNLQGLADVSNATPTTNDVLTWTGSIWEPQAPTGSTANTILGVLVQNAYTGNGTGNTFVLTNSTSNANSLIVFVDSVLQEPLTNYTITGTTLTFTSAPVNGASIDVRYFAQDEFDIALGELNNVSNSTPLTGQALIWSGIQWAPSNVSTSANVTSVNGLTGVVTLTTSNISEGTNLYFTNARSRGALSVTGAGSYDSSTGVITITGGVTSVGGDTGAVSNAQLASAITSSGILTTANVTEDSNLYFTNARVSTAVSSQTLTNATFSANVTASYFVGDGSALTNISSTGATVLFQDARPSTTSSNVLWWQSNVGKLKVYYSDGSSAQWVDASPGGVTNYYTNVISQVTVTNETSSSSTYYPIITTSTSGNLTASNVTTTKLSFVPSTGTLTVTNLNTTSDATLKQEIKFIDNSVKILKKINPVSFKWKDTKKQSYGVLAQDLEKILPELVSENASGKTVSYLPLISLLIKAVQEQQEQIEKLKRKLNAN